MTRPSTLLQTTRPIVYVREVARDELPVELQAAPGPFYSVHDEDGNRLALAHDRKIAFALARENAFTPCSVH